MKFTFYPTLSRILPMSRKALSQQQQHLQNVIQTHCPLDFRSLCKRREMTEVIRKANNFRIIDLRNYKFRVFV